MNCILKRLCKVIAVCDKNLSDGFLENTKIKTFKDFNKILEEDIDTVIVCMLIIAHIVTMAALRKDFMLREATEKNRLRYRKNT